MTERPPQGAPRPLWQEPGVTGLHRPREADAVVTVRGARRRGRRGALRLARGRLAARRGGRRLAARRARGAVEQALRPPYRARAVRRGETLWAIEAKRIEVLSIPDAPGATRSTSRTPRRARRSRSTASGSSARSPCSSSAASAREASTPCTRNGSTTTSGRCAPRRSDMGIFRRRKEETLNEQMLREAGIDPDGDTPLSRTPGLRHSFVKFRSRRRAVRRSRSIPTPAAIPPRRPAARRPRRAWPGRPSGTS